MHDRPGDVVPLRALSRKRPRYDQIGYSYAQTRCEDPRLANLIHAALGGARTVVNVGAGSGSYEPRDRLVIAIEPSDVMADQRPAELPPAIRASAGEIPLRDQSVDAAMAILTIHHWDDELAAGISEMRRVSRGPIVILTYDPKVSGQMWLMADYLPEVAELDQRIFPAIEQLTEWLGEAARADVVEIPRDTPDWTLGSFWAHPERVLDPIARGATSGFARMPADVVDRVVSAVGRDLQDGSWDRRHGHLRELESFDAGLRLVASGPPLRDPASQDPASQDPASQHPPAQDR